jgi:hypothetical protein
MTDTRIQAPLRSSCTHSLSLLFAVYLVLVVDYYIDCDFSSVVDTLNVTYNTNNTGNLCNPRLLMLLGCNVFLRSWPLG